MIKSQLTLQEAKERLFIPELWKRFNLPGQPRKSCRSPFRKDQKPSFSVYDQGKKWMDHGAVEGGDAINFLEKCLYGTVGVYRKEAAKEFLKMVNGSIYVKPYFKTVPTYFPKLKENRRQIQLPELREGAEGELRHLSALRNISIQGLQVASNLGLLKFATFMGHSAWAVTDVTRNLVQFRRMDGQVWKEINCKSWSFTNGRAGWPVGIKEASTCERIVLVEGEPDLLSACHFTYNRADVGRVMVAGGSKRIDEEALPLFKNKHVKIIAHVDKAGKSAVRRWTTQLREVDCKVDVINLAKLTKIEWEGRNWKNEEGYPVKDLNDCLLLHPKCFAQGILLWRAFYE